MVGVGFYKAANGIYCWVQEFSSDPDKKCTLTLKANGGTFSNGSDTYIMQFPCEMKIDFTKDIPLPTKDGHTLTGWQWYTVTIPGITLGDNETVSAIWTPNS